MTTELTQGPSIESLAETFALIHGHCLLPFYEWDGTAEPMEFSYSWERIPAASGNDETVDKEFFRSIARFAIEKLSASITENERVTEMARIVSAVHGRCLAPFYSHAANFPDYAASYDFQNLPDEAQERGQLDKEFVLRVARHILRKHRNQGS
jgi:hypothetical protein